MRKHQPVMLAEVSEALPEQCHFVMDGTLGHGGHSIEIIKRMMANQEIVTSSTYNNELKIVGVDRDEAMLGKAKVFLEEEKVLDVVQFVQGSYADFDTIITESGVKQFDYILLDIGVNMDHFKVANRGFSIKLDGPLDMRYNRTQGIPASKIIEKYNYKQLLMMWGKWTDFSDKFCELITKELITTRKKQTFVTTQDMRTWAKKLGINDKKLAVIFQALRIETNNELGELEKFLQLFPNFLTNKGRCSIITYHSIEDRLVKYAFKDLVTQGIGVLVNKKVIKPHRQEVKKNKAARSAKLRIFEKI